MEDILKFVFDRENAVMLLNTASNLAFAWKYGMRPGETIMESTTLRPPNVISVDALSMLGGTHLALALLSLGKLIRNHQIAVSTEKKAKEKFIIKPKKRKVDSLILLVLGVANLTQLWIRAKLLKSPGGWTNSNLKKTTVINAVLTLLNFALMFFCKIKN